MQKGCRKPLTLIWLRRPTNGHTEARCPPNRALQSKRLTVTSDIEWSSCKITWRPFGSVYFSNSISGIRGPAAAKFAETNMIVRTIVFRNS